MKKIIFIMIFVFLISSLGCGGKEPVKNKGAKEPSKTAVKNTQIKETAGKESQYDIVMKRDLLCIMMAYPEYVSGVEKKDDGIYLVMKSGKQILYDDKKSKSHDGKVLNADIQDMMEQIYPLNDIKSLMEINYDPGRGRVYSLFKDVYGDSKEQVQSNLSNVKTGYGNYQFNKNNNAASSLKKVMDELVPLARGSRKIYASFFPSSGTFNYRNIAGTNVLSAHSFGIAIDLARDKRDYWRWASREQGQERIKSYPREIVTVFEKNNFIWGGKWGHFDILHFEYRPEIIYKAKYFAAMPQQGEPWYRGAPDDLQVKEYIDIIDKALE